MCYNRRILRTGIELNLVLFSGTEDATCQYGVDKEQKYIIGVTINRFRVYAFSRQTLNVGAQHP